MQIELKEDESRLEQLRQGWQELMSANSLDHPFLQLSRAIGLHCTRDACPACRDHATWLRLAAPLDAPLFRPNCSPSKISLARAR